MASVREAAETARTSRYEPAATMPGFRRGSPGFRIPQQAPTRVFERDRRRLYQSAQSGRGADEADGAGRWHGHPRSRSRRSSSATDHAEIVTAGGRMITAGKVLVAAGGFTNRQGPAARSAGSSSVYARTVTFFEVNEDGGGAPFRHAVADLQARG